MNFFFEDFACPSDRPNWETALRENEAYFRALFNLAGVGIAQTDLKARRFLLVNRAFCEIVGYPEEELLSLTVDEINHPEDRARDAKLYAKLLQEETTNYQSEKRYLRKDGSIVWVLATRNIVRDAAGKPLRAFAVIQDISDRKKAELEIHKFVSLADNSSEFIGICDMDFVPLYLNQAGRKLVGLDNLEQQSEISRISVEDFFFPEDRDFIFNEFFPQVGREGWAEVEIRFRQFQTGEALWMIYTVHCI
jgi:hypothetical protein